MGRKKEIIELLQSSGSEYACFVASLPDGHSSERLNPEGWSVVQVAEHVVLAEKAMLGMFLAGRATTSLGDKCREERFAAIMANREGRAKAPPAVMPTGSIGTLADALSEFTAAREESIRAFEQDQRELGSVACHHPMFGPVNGYEMLVLVAGHANRHLAQIREIVGRRK